MGKRFVKRIIAILFGIYALGTVFPVYWLIVNSFKNSEEIVSGNSIALPTKLLWSNYTGAIVDNHILSFFFNSVIVTGLTILLTLVLSTMLGYSLARMRWKGSRLVLTYVSIGFLVPVQVVFIPVFMLVRSLHLIDNQLSLVITVAAFSLSLSTLIIYGLLRGIPYEMEEAAVIDGCGIVRLFVYVILPIIKPALATAAINIFIQSWNEFIFALLFISNVKKMTLPLALLNFQGMYGTDWGGMFAAMVVCSILPIIVFFAFNSQMEKAITAGAILK